MLQLFLKARAHDYFKARSGARDASTDHSRLRPIAEAIETAIVTAEAEHTGLNRRIRDVIARAAVTFGNGADEYLERDTIDSRHQDALGIEIRDGERRLAELESQIGNLMFIKAAMAARFQVSQSN